MGRRDKSIPEILMIMPWWCSPLLALVAYIVIAYILPLVVPHDSPLFATVPNVLSRIAPLAAFALLVPMPFAYVYGRRKKRLVDTQRNLDSIRTLSWKEFEQLVAEAYRREGYKVRENFSQGPDGGVDLTLEKDGQLHLVQCKQWKKSKVGVQIVREMYGVMVAQNASSVSIICSGLFTQEAKNFADDKPIDLIDGPELTRLIANVQVPSLAIPESTGAEVKSDLSTSCPQCGNQLVTRTARRGRNVGKQFLACSSFPTCKYTRERVE